VSKFNAEAKARVVVTSLSEFRDYLPSLQAAEVIAFDTETTGLAQFDKAVGISLAPNEDLGIYIPFSIWNGTELVNPWNKESYDELISSLKALLLSKKLVAHNAVFDCKVIRNTLGFELIDNIHCDTAVLHHTVVDENPPHGLKDLAALFLTESANTPQEDLKASVVANGGKWLTSDKEFFKGDYNVLGEYAAWDVIYTYALYNLWYPKIEQEGLQDLWFKEALPLIKVSYDLNTTGLEIDVDYFKQLKQDMAANIENIEAIIFSEIAEKVEEYEYQIALKNSKISARSELGKLLPLEAIKKDPLTVFDEEGNILSVAPQYKETIMAWYKKKKDVKRVFNLDSNVDKAFLLYDVLGFECTTKTSSGKRSASKADFERILEENQDNEVVKLLAKRQKEIKLLSTYVEAFLERHIDGRIYPSFNQIGTVSGRYSSNSPNFQVLPRDDLRIKKGIKADEGYVFISADQAALEARVYAFMSGSPGIKEVYFKGLDLYSKLAIDIMKLENVTANKKDDNYLGNVDKEMRQTFKAVALAVVYGSGAYRLASMMKKTPEEAQDIIDAYLSTYPELADYMKKSEFMGMKRGYVTTIVGRRKRFQYIHKLYNKYGIKDINIGAIRKLWYSVPSLATKFESDKHLLRLARNELNLAKNFRIQSLAASVVNAGMIRARTLLNEAGLDAKTCLQVHDSITLLVKKEDADKACKILQDAMENNWVTSMIDIPLIAEPVIGKDLSEDK
jgi:DNA polymerase-1